MKRSVRLLSLLAAFLLLLTACTSADESTEPVDSGAEEDAVVEEESPPSGSVEDESVPPETSSTDDSILAIAQDNPQLSQLVTALQAAGLTDALEQAGPLTVFAPNNDAFAKIDAGDLAALLADPTSLGDVLQYHVVEGAATSGDLSDGQELTTLQGASLPVSIDGSTVTVGNAQVVQADITAGNGVIHVIDTVLEPPSS